jgi:hypothetical protein
MSWPPNVNDHMRVAVELHRRFRVGDRFNKCDIRLTDVLQDVLCLPSGTDTKHVHVRALSFDLLSKPGEHFNRVLYGIAVWRAGISRALHLRWRERLLWWT